MDEKTWLLASVIIDVVLCYSETINFGGSCAYRLFKINPHKTYDVIWNGNTVEKDDCRLGFKPAEYIDKSIAICVDTKEFVVHKSDCNIRLKIDEEFDLVKDLNCNESFTHWCASSAKAIHLSLKGANAVNVSGHSKFRLYIFTHEFTESLNTETVIFVAFLAGFIVLSTALCIIRHLSYKICNGRRRGTNMHTGHTNRDLPQDDSFLRGFTLPPPTYSFVMSHPETCNTSQTNTQDDDQPDTQRPSADRVTFGLPSTNNTASSSTGTLPPSYSSLQLTNFQGIQPSINPS